MTKTQDLELITNSLRGHRSIAFMKGLFKTVNQLYRECIDRVQAAADHSASDESGEEDLVQRKAVPTVSLAELRERAADGESIITEIDMVEQVFEIIKSEISNSASQEQSETAAPDVNYLLAVAMAYASSLLSFLIFPHRKLQSFLFTLASDSKNFVTLQYLINFRVVMDSHEILNQLTTLSEKYGEQQRWLCQARMDMAKRMRRTHIVLECLIQDNRSRELVEYLRASDPRFEIEKLFSIMSKLNAPHRASLWEQVEAWNVSPGLPENERPVLSHKVVMLNAR